MLDRTFADVTHLDDRGENLELAQRSLAGEIRTYHMEKRYLQKAGTTIWAQLDVALARAAAGRPIHFVAQIQNIADCKRAETEADRFFTESLNLLTVATFGGSFLRVNPAWESALGFTPAELLAEQVLNFVHPDDRAAGGRGRPRDRTWDGSAV